MTTRRAIALDLLVGATISAVTFDEGDTRDRMELSVQKVDGAVTHEAVIVVESMLGGRLRVLTATDWIGHA